MEKDLENEHFPGLGEIRAVQHTRKRTFSSDRSHSGPCETSYRRVGVYTKSLERGRKERERRRRVRALVVKGYTQKQIAHELGISTRTVMRDWDKIRSYLKGQQNREMREQVEREKLEFPQKHGLSSDDVMEFLKQSKRDFPKRLQAANTGISNPRGIYVFGANATEWWQPNGQGFTAQSYNPYTNTWTNVSVFHIVRDGAGVAVVNDEIYVIGGYTYVSSSPPSLFPVKTAFSAANEQYSPSSGNETSNPSNTPPISNETSNNSSPSNTSNNSNTSNISNILSVRITLLSPANQTYFSNDVSLLFSVDNVSSLIRYSLDGKKATIITGNTTIKGLRIGLHNITIYVEDDFGNVEASETSYFNIAEESFPLTSIVVVSTISVIVFLSIVVYLKNKPKR